MKLIPSRRNPATDPVLAGPSSVHPAPLAIPERRRDTGGRGAGTRSKVTGPGAVLVFELLPANPGVHVMRVHERTDGTRVHCSVLFDDPRAFGDWLDADPLRFTHPLVFQQARRLFSDRFVGTEVRR